MPLVTISMHESSAPRWSVSGLSEREQPVVHRPVVGMVLGRQAPAELGATGVDVRIDQARMDECSPEVPGGRRRCTGPHLPVRADRGDDPLPDGYRAVDEDAAPAVHRQDAAVPEQSIDSRSGFPAQVSNSTGPAYGDACRCAKRSAEREPRSVMDGALEGEGAAVRVA